MENENLKPIEKLTPFTKMIMTIGTLPSSFYASMSYYESMVWLYEYLKNQVIPTVNNNGEAVEELQEKFIELKEWTETYTEETIPTEIENKLDEMAEDGTLTSLIAQYINTNSQLLFNNIEEMKESTIISNGAFIKTYGHYNYNDNGNANYKVRLKTNEDVIDEMTLLSLYDEDLVAELIIENNTVTPEQFGAYGDGIHDDTSIFQAINTKFDNLNPSINVQGKRGKTYLIEELTTHNINIIDCSFKGKTAYSSNGINIWSGTRLYRCVFSQFNQAVYSTGTYNVYSEINNCTFQYNRFGAYFIGTASGGVDYSQNDLRIINSYFVKNGTNADDMTADSTPSNGYGIYIDNSFHNILIQGNLIEYNTFTGIYLNQTEAIHNNGCTIIGNYFEGNRNSAIYMNGAINRKHMIMITGNFYSSGTVNVRKTRYIDVKKIFTSAYIMEDINEITVNPPTGEGITINDDHTITYSYGASQYQNFTPVHNNNDIFRIRFVCTVDDHITLNIGNQQSFQLPNGYTEIVVSGITNFGNWYFTRAIGQNESVTLLGSY